MHSLVRAVWAVCLSRYQRAVEEPEGDRLLNLSDLQMSRWPLKIATGKKKINLSTARERERQREIEREREREREDSVREAEGSER